MTNYYILIDLWEIFFPQNVSNFASPILSNNNLKRKTYSTKVIRRLKMYRKLSLKTKQLHLGRNDDIFSTQIAIRVAFTVS